MITGHRHAGPPGGLPALRALVALATVGLVGLVGLSGCVSAGKPPARSEAGATAGSAARGVSSSTDPDEAPDAAAAGATPPPAATETPAATGRSCRAGDPLANVYHPSRLHVVRSCLTVTGLVVGVRKEADGDLHVNVRLDPPYAGLINDRNFSGEGGALVTEVVPADEPGCTPGQPPRPPEGTYDYGVCTGADETAPALGARVAVTGPYVLDADHGWMEIHPVWSFGAAPPPGAPSPATVASTVAPPSAAPAGSVQITSAPSSIAPGQVATVTAQTSPGAACSLDVVLPSGRHSTASGLGPATADSTGAVSWNWTIGTSTRAGTATADVTCPAGATSTTFQIT